uniref:BolA family member 3 n=1 Tax=Taeniopygia guttata TaxID=59729 RepID=A0A674GJP1_TAEGU
MAAQAPFLGGAPSVSSPPWAAGTPSWGRSVRVVNWAGWPGGCGDMYEIHVESEEFREKRPVQQHRMVTQALSEEIKHMHGLRIFTSAPKA